MKRTIVAVLIGFACFGCALTPKPVLRAGDMAMDGMNILEQNFIAVVNGYVDKTNEAYTQGLMTWFNGQIAALTDAEGKVDIVSYNRLTASLAQRIAQNRALLEVESEMILTRIAQQFAIVRNLQYLVNEYNVATGIPPETMELLIETTIEILDSIAEVRASQQSSTSSGVLSQIDWVSVIERIGRDEYASILAEVRDAIALTNEGENE